MTDSITTSVLVCTPVRPDEGGGGTHFNPAWATETVQALVAGIDAERAFDRLPILADALEEAGCDDLLLLRHCRECPTHTTDCWALRSIREVVAAEKAQPRAFEWYDDGVPSIYAADPTPGRVHPADKYTTRALTIMYVARWVIVFVVFVFFAMMFQKYFGFR